MWKALFLAMFVVAILGLGLRVAGAEIRAFPEHESSATAQEQSPELVGIHATDVAQWASPVVYTPFINNAWTNPPTIAVDPKVAFEVQAFAKGDGVSTADQNVVVQDFISCVASARQKGLTSNIYLFFRPEKAPEPSEAPSPR